LVLKLDIWKEKSQIKIIHNESFHRTRLTARAGELHVNLQMEEMKELADMELPDGFRIDSVVRNVTGETNNVFFCKGVFNGRPVRAYIKASKQPKLSLDNENSTLTKLKSTRIPIPNVIWYGGLENDTLIVEAMRGHMIWDYIDPRRNLYSKDKALLYLTAYGHCLAQIHCLDITWPPQKRSRLHGFIGEENVDDERFRRLVSWITSNNGISPGQVFVHGDFNTASVLFHKDSISGVIDWEFAGSGWREYDLAWALRARLHFLNTKAERQAILNGYKLCTTYNTAALQWCEVLNYLHFAYWSKENELEYMMFALERAIDIAGLK